MLDLKPKLLGMKNLKVILEVIKIVLLLVIVIILISNKEEGRFKVSDKYPVVIDSKTGKLYNLKDNISKKTP